MKKILLILISVVLYFNVEAKKPKLKTEAKKPTVKKAKSNPPVKKTKKVSKK